MSKPNKQDFTEAVVTVLSASGIHTILKFDKINFALEIRTGSSEHTLFLGRTYERYCRAPVEERQAILVNFCSAATTVEIPKTLAEAAPRLFPFLQTVDFFEQANASTTDDGKRLPYCRLLENIGQDVVYDSPFKMSHISRNHLVTWGSNFDEIYRIALENLRSATYPSFEQGGSVFLANWGDPYGASRLVLPEVFEGLQVKGNPVALVIDSGTVAVTGSEDVQGILTLTSLVEKYKAEGSLEIIMPVITLVNGKWDRFSPSSDSQIALDCVHYIDLHAQLSSFKIQAQQLEKTCADMGLARQTFFVSEEMGTGRLSSHCFWPEGGKSLLPRSENIIFMRKTNGPKQFEDIGAASWTVVNEILGDLLEPFPSHPNWVITRRFPSSPELEVIMQRDPEGSKYSTRWSETNLDDEPGNRVKAIQLGVRPCPGTIQVGSMEWRQNAVLQRFKSALPFEDILEFYKASMQSSSPGLSAITVKDGFAMLSYSRGDQDIYVCMTKVPEVGTVAIFVEMQLIDADQVQRRIADYLAGKPYLELSGPIMITDKKKA